MCSISRRSSLKIASDEPTLPSNKHVRFECTTRDTVEENAEYKCVCCNQCFLLELFLQLHLQSDFHWYNVMKVLGKEPPMKLEEFLKFKSTQTLMNRLRNWNSN